ncbi:MAG: hypothetical protein D6800_10350 [Candidatus Zixiibacteriota bacterium]|nr:MAG: hypothetical protein D6800_10350 [candidate division Zixibacteria bacterium]
MLRRRLLDIFLFAVIAGTGVSVSGHVDDPNLPEGCGSCHVGHGVPNQPMLPLTEEQFCYQCHSSEVRRAEMQAEGRLAEGVVLKDIEQVFRKPYHHPVEEGTGHDPAERLPSLQPGKVSHAECTDCHNPHQRVSPGRPQRFEVSGYSLSGQYLDEATYEYQVCLKCHVDPTSINRTGRDVGRAFAASVASQHPVTRPADGPRSPSLIATRDFGQMMRCSDCHTNDDPNGPRGPHGSNYPFMLSGNYDRSSYTDESPFTFEFCYSCHDRSSILNNESFPLHREHIQGNIAKGTRGTSCATCHNAHSSADNPFLLDFNNDAVSPNSSGRLQYVRTGVHSGECYLSCHNHDHNPGRY